MVPGNWNVHFGSIDWGICPALRACRQIPRKTWDSAVSPAILCVDMENSDVAQSADPKMLEIDDLTTLCRESPGSVARHGAFTMKGLVHVIEGPAGQDLEGWHGLK